MQKIQHVKLDFLFSDNTVKIIDLQTITRIELLSVVQRYFN